MHILAIGLDYRKAPVALREKFTISEEDLPEALKRLRQTRSILECVIVSTCNRTEIYAVVDRKYICGHYVRTFMSEWFRIPLHQFSGLLTTYEDDAAIRHLFQVACGLDSMVIGETQILGQVKQAFLIAQRQKTTGTLFNTLFKQAVTLAKRAHSETELGENAVSVSYAAIELGKRIFGSFRKKNVMVIGAGKMSELTVKHLLASGVDQVVVANRTLNKAEQLAKSFSGAACAMEEIEAALVDKDIDIVLSSTGAHGLVLTRAQVERVMSRRPAKPLFMIDIAVPRDLDPGIAQLQNVYLYDIDDLQGIVDANIAIRKREAVKVEQMIAQEMDAFARWYRTLGVSPLIRALQEKAEAIHHDTMESLLRKLPDLSEHEVKVIRKLSKSMINQMIHEPILRIKELAAEKRSQEAMALFTQLFALEGLIQEDAALAGKDKPAETDSLIKDALTPVSPAIVRS
ncbi:MAG TPA: glutamyl-tRNA reductase [Bacilli bacterium]